MSVFSIYEKYFGKEIYFIYSYTLIHFILISYAYFQIETGFTPPVFYKFTLFGTSTNIFEMYSGIQGFVYSYISLLLIFLIDIGFLIVLMFEFKTLRLNYRKIMSIEAVLIGISFFSPFFREVMFFMSFNTVGIYIIYRLIMKNVWFLKFPFLFSSYVFIIRLILTPLYEMMRFSK